MEKKIESALFLQKKPYKSTVIWIDKLEERRKKIEKLLKK